MGLRCLDVGDAWRRMANRRNDCKLAVAPVFIGCCPLPSCAPAHIDPTSLLLALLPCSLLGVRHEAQKLRSRVPASASQRLSMSAALNYHCAYRHPASSHQSLPDTGQLGLRQTASLIATACLRCWSQPVQPCDDFPRSFSRLSVTEHTVRKRMLAGFSK